jgi:PilZ domain-containing protein
MSQPAFTIPASEQPLSAAELRAMRDQWKEFRRFRRKSVILASTLETPRGTVQCVALDLSLGGARIRVQERLDPLEQVTLVLAKFGRFPAQVVWRNAVEAGLQFCDPPEEVAKRFGSDIPFD